MKRNLKYFSVFMATSVLLVGCTTAHHATQWEYKVAGPTGAEPNSKKVIEPFLNNLAKDGWIFIQTDATGWYYFKRAKT